MITSFFFFFLIYHKCYFGSNIPRLALYSRDLVAVQNCSNLIMKPRVPRRIFELIQLSLQFFYKFMHVNTPHFSNDKYQ